MGRNGTGAVTKLKYKKFKSSKIYACFVIFCDKFPNFCRIDVFSLEMDSQVYEGNFQLFPATEEANLGNFNVFFVFCKMHFYA